MSQQATVTPAQKSSIGGGARQIYTLKRQKVHNLTMTQLVVYFLNKRNFYAHALSEIPKIPDASCPTMYVTVKKCRYLMKYHPEWYKYLAEIEAAAVLEHEGLHILLGHIPRFNKLIKSLTDKDAIMRARAVGNYAADMAVNTIMAAGVANHLPEGAIYAKDFGLPEGKSFEYYLAQLMPRVRIENIEPGMFTDQDAVDGGADELIAPPKNAPKSYTNVASTAVTDSDTSTIGDDIVDPDEKAPPAPKIKATSTDPTLNSALSGQDISGNHQLEIDEADADDLAQNPDAADMEDILEEESTRILKEAAKAIDVLAGGTGRGNVPGAFREKLQGLEKVAPRAWQDILLSKIQRAKSSTEEYRINALNMDRVTLGTGVGMFGAREDADKFVIDFGIDTSASMDDDAIGDVLSVLQALVRGDCDIRVRVVEFDTIVHRRYWLEKNDVVTPEVHGRGGTNFNPYFKEVKDGVDADGKKIRPDMIIVGTDGEAPAPQEEFRIPTARVPLVWLLVNSAYTRSPCPEFGEEVHLVI